MNDNLQKASGYLLYLLFILMVSIVTWFSIRSRPLVVFLAVLATWLCYAGAHRQLTGEMVHVEGEDIEERGADTLRRKLGVVVGAVLSFLAFPICIMAVNTMSFPLLTLGFLMFFSGYMIMHYNWFDEPI